MMHRDNLIIALQYAIAARQRSEQYENGPDFKSSLVAGWEEVLDNVTKGGSVTFFDELESTT